MQIVMTLALLLAALAGQMNATKGRVTIESFDEGGSSFFTVSVKDAKDDELVVSRICYWTKPPVGISIGGSGELVRCATSVQPAISQTAVMMDSVPVPLSKIYSVRVQVVRVEEEQIIENDGHAIP